MYKQLFEMYQNETNERYKDLIRKKQMYLFSLFNTALLDSGLGFRLAVTRRLQRLPVSTKT